MLPYSVILEMTSNCSEFASYQPASQLVRVVSAVGMDSSQLPGFKIPALPFSTRSLLLHAPFPHLQSFK